MRVWVYSGKPPAVRELPQAWSRDMRPQGSWARSTGGRHLDDTADPAELFFWRSVDERFRRGRFGDQPQKQQQDWEWWQQRSQSQSSNSNQQHHGQGWQQSWPMRRLGFRFNVRFEVSKLIVTLRLLLPCNAIHAVRPGNEPSQLRFSLRPRSMYFGEVALWLFGF